ncbi:MULTISPECIES: alpha/beta fold hydrolase [unclassified Arthrobacter]|uniref:alpha/beta hydrolase n=1 Tax=unclassified Arthrobacter TaxID=235627 RepID=UPI002882E49D|nr:MULTISPECIES: alpha/beta fold hydrolase [unclassified Arthrobacter]
MSALASKKLDFPISITDQDGLQFAGHFFPSGGRGRGVLQVLVHGISYDHRYWNAGLVNGRDYSYVTYMASQGFDLLAIDLPGTGASDKPDGHSVSLEAVGSALSSLVERLKEPGVIPGKTFDHIALIGHSMGASLSVYSEARWPAADSLVVTATGFFPGRPRSAWAPGAREALLSDPYAVVPKEGRLKFYHQQQADPDVISYDNDVLRTPIPSGLWTDCIALQDDPDAGFAKVTCPVFIQLGEFDPILPGRFAADEKALYASSTEVVVDPIPDIGHSFNLHLNAQRSWSGISEFLQQRNT